MSELFELIRDYGPEAVAGAVQKAHAARGFGADYIANILRLQNGRREVQPPVSLHQPELNDARDRFRAPPRRALRPSMRVRCN
jgi:hypothetical protein